MEKRTNTFPVTLQVDDHSTWRHIISPTLPSNLKTESLFVRWAATGFDHRWEQRGVSFHPES